MAGNIRGDERETRNLQAGESARALFNFVVSNILSEVHQDFELHRAAFETSDDPYARSAHAVIAATIKRQAGDTSSASDWFERSAAAAPPDSYAHALGLLLEAGFRATLGERAHSVRLRQQAEAIDLPDIGYMTMTLRAHHSLLTGDFASAEAIARDAQQALTAGDQPAYWHINQLVEAQALFYLDRPAAAEGALRASLIRNDRPPHLLPLIDHFLGLSLAQMGALRSAVPRMERASEGLTTLPPEFLGTWPSLAEACLRVHLVDHAERAANAALHAAQQFPNSQAHAIALMSSIRVAVTRGDFAATSALLDEATVVSAERGDSELSDRALRIAGALNPNLPPVWLTVRDFEEEPTLARAVLQAARQSDDPTLFFEVLSAAVDIDHPLIRPLALYALVRLALDRDDAEAAIDHLFDLLEATRAYAQPIDSIHIRSTFNRYIVDMSGLALHFGLQANRFDVVHAIMVSIEHSVYDIARRADEPLPALEVLDQLRQSVDTDSAADNDELHWLDRRLGELRRCFDLTTEDRIPVPLDRSLTMPNTPTIIFTQNAVSLFRITVIDGEISIVMLGTVKSLVSLSRRLRFSVAALAVNPAASASVDEVALKLEAILFGSLRLGPERPHAVHPGQTLLAVPWSFLPAVRSGAASIRLRANSAPEEPTAAPRSVLAVASATDNPDAAAEAAAVAACYETSTVLTGRDASPEKFLPACSTHDVVHISGFRNVVRRTATESNVFLDGGEVTLYEIEHLERVAPIVIVAATTPRTIGPVEHEVNYFLAQSMISRGARSVIVAPIDLAPEVSAQVMPALHRNLVAGLSPRAAIAALSFADAELQRAAATLVCIEAEPPNSAEAEPPNGAGG